MSHTTKAGNGTVFIHNGDYSGDVEVISTSYPENIITPEGERWSISVPFTDMRQFVFAYLRGRKIEQLEQCSDDTLETLLLGSELAW